VVSFLSLRANFAMIVRLDFAILESKPQQSPGINAITVSLYPNMSFGETVGSRSVLDDFDPYIDDAERAELGESRVLVKDELYMPVHPSRDWIKCFVTSTQQDGFR
jgi:hypothetical protein